MAAEWKWVTLASGFPPTLNKETACVDLKPSETPAAYGLEYDKPGLLCAGSCPTGETRIVREYTVGANTYQLFFNRLWRASGATLYWNSPEYTAVLLPQGLGHMDFSEKSSNDIVAFLPQDENMAVLTANGGYLVPGASSPANNFIHTDIFQEVLLANSAYLTELDGTVYVSNANGLFSWKGDTITEITAPVRNSIAPFASCALKTLYAKKLIIGTSQFVYDAVNKRLFDYSTSGFLYTSPTLHEPDYRPIVVSKLGFVLDRVDTDRTELSLSVKLEDRDWESLPTALIGYEEDKYSLHVVSLETQLTCRRFAMRIDTMLSNVRIRSIYVCARVSNLEGYSL